MNTSKTNAGRLVMTEEAYFSSVAQQKCYDDLDVEEYEIVATLDSHTSEICQSLDGKHFPMKDYQAGVTAPPFHVRCRSTTVPYLEDNFGQFGERAARDSETGKTYYVPDNISYPEWKNTFVDGKGDLSVYDVYESNGTIHYKQPTPPEAPPQKEYLTEKKLKAKIADVDVQIEDLENQFKAVGVGYTYDDIIKDFGSLEDFAEGEDLATLKSLKASMDALKAQKAEWQTKLDEKLIAKQKKALTKQQIELEAQKAAVQKQLDEIEVKTYSGIWYNKDVTTADYPYLDIQKKKDYYTNSIATSTDPDIIEKHKAFLKQVEELETEGKAYSEVQDELNKIQNELKKVQADLTSLENNGTIKENPFTQERKDAAYWFKQKAPADAVLRSKSGEVWRNGTTLQRNAAFEYTSGSGSFNRPLRGYDKNWHNFKGVGKVDLDNEGSGAAIKHLTDLIDKSSYDFDIWLNRGIETTSGAASFLQIPESVLLSASQSELEKLLIGKIVKDEAFVSCGSAKGTGFNGYIFNVYAPKGTKMLYAEPFSAFGNGGGKNWDGYSGQKYFGSEFETIIQRGTEFRIIKIEKSGGNLYFDIEIVGQP